MIGRTEEKKYLQSLINEDVPQFVAVYGRRRIGKTYLIRESFEHSFTFEHTGVSNSDFDVNSLKVVQLEKFQESLAEFGYKPSEKITSWNEAFNGLKEVIKASKEKKTFHKIAYRRKFQLSRIAIAFAPSRTDK